MTDHSDKQQDLHELDQWTSGAFHAATSGERAAKLREWLLTNPTSNQLQRVFTEMSHRDKGAAKLVRERLDELRRAQNQDAIVQEWASKAQLLCDADKLNLADAMAWQRDAAKAGAPLSREPLAALKTALNERVKAIEDLQHQTLVQREAAVLLAQRIEVLSTKSWQDALTQREALQADLQRWIEQAQALQSNAQWPSVDAKFPVAIHTSTQQVQAVWEAFVAALEVAQTAATDAAAPLPAVPAWAEQIKQWRQGTTPEAVTAIPAPAVVKAPSLDATRVKKFTADKSVIDAQRLALALRAEALFKPAAASESAVSSVEASSMASVDAPAPQTDTQAPPSETPSTVSETPVADAAAPVTTTPVASEPVSTPSTSELIPVLTGRKLQEALRELREAWKKVDKEAAPNPALWKRFDTACNRAHDVVQAWLKESRAQSSAVKNQRVTLIEEVKAWAAAHAAGPDWKTVARQLHEFAQRWRDGGHLSEKAYAELHPQWKAAIHAAYEPWETAQKASIARRQALIEEAKALGQAPTLRIDEVKALQQRWQQEAHTVALDRKQEQRLWDAFRQPIDQAFARKPATREAAHPPLGAHDKAVMEAAKALQAASGSGDASRIRQAMQALEAILNGETPAAPSAAPASDVASAPAQTEVSDAQAAPSDAATSSDTPPEATTEAPVEAPAQAAPAPVAPKPVRPVVAVRGDDRPGQKRTELPVKSRDSKFRDAKPRPGGKEHAPRAPRVADVAFRAQRQAFEAAQNALRQLAAQAHGEVLTQLLHAWEKRDASAVPSLQTLGSKLNAAQRTQWVHSIEQAPQSLDEQALLRLEIAADVSTPAADVAARRALQLQLLTRRHDPSPQMTWAADASKVLAGTYDDAKARRLQTALKQLLKR